MNTKTKQCPKCWKKHLVFIYGCGWDYDAWVCMKCDYTKELKTSTMPKANNE